MLSQFLPRCRQFEGKIENIWFLQPIGVDESNLTSYRLYIPLLDNLADEFPAINERYSEKVVSVP